jgi:hypothetical protein
VEGKNTKADKWAAPVTAISLATGISTLVVDDGHASIWTRGVRTALFFHDGAPRGSPRFPVATCT